MKNTYLSNEEKRFSETALIFWSVFRSCFWEIPDFLKTKKNRSEIASSFPAVARLDLSYVSENKGFGKQIGWRVRGRGVAGKSSEIIERVIKNEGLGIRPTRPTRATRVRKRCHQVLLGASPPHAPVARMTWVRTNSLKLTLASGY